MCPGAPQAPSAEIPSAAISTAKEMSAADFERTPPRKRAKLTHGSVAGTPPPPPPPVESPELPEMDRNMIPQDM